MPSSLGPSEGHATLHTQEIVTFVEDGAVSTDPIPPSGFVPTHLDADDTMVNSVMSFLRRPILYTTGLWQTTDVALTQKSIVRLPRNWLNNAMIREKLSGFRYLKCDFKIRVQVNAMPFQAGRLLMYFEPLFTQNTLEPSSSTHFGGITGYPHVELDLMNETSMEITVPFNNILTHYDLIRGLGAAGAVKVVVYSPLTGDPASTADISVWMWADNIDIQLPTGMPLAPALPTREDNAQAGGSGRKAEAKRPGNIETISRSVGNIAGSLGSIPFLSAITGPISAVTDAVASVASIFGWSKPQDPEFPLKAELGYAKHYTNFNGDVKAKVLALDARNQVEIPAYVSYTGEDEMSLAYLVQKYTFLGRFAWAATDLTDTIVFNVPNVPDYCVSTTHPWTAGSFDASFQFNTMLSYLSGMFAFWRGTLKYKFKIVKSPFHTGRLRIDLVPGYAGTGDYVREKIYSQIVDIRETNEFEIEVPYKWNAPWKRLALDPATNKFALTPTALFVRVLNPLRNGGQSAPNVELLVEVAGGPDFQFAYPIIKNGVRPLNAASSYAVQPDNAQSGEIIASPKPGFEANSLGIGEVVTSLRQVLKRYTPMKNEPNITYGPNASLLYPFVMSHNVPDGLDPTFDLTISPVFKQTPDFYSYTSYLYRFRSGSMRVASILGPQGPDVPATPVNFAILNSELIPPEFDYNLPGPHAIFTSSPNNFQFKQNEPFVEFQVPFYQLWPATLTELGIPSRENSSGIAIQGFNNVPYNQGTTVIVQAPIAETTTMTFSRAIGEDFNLAFAVGPPITVIPVPKTP